MFKHRKLTRNSNKRLRPLHSAVATWCEPLERRRLLSTIAWPGRGSPTSDTDGFNALFGANATNARFCVDRAIADWEEVINNFNYNNGGNTYILTVTTANLGGGIIANSTITGTRGGKPTAGTLRIGSVGVNHYVDPEIGDDGEFTTITNPFTGYAPGISGTDLYATALHEIGHLMGFTQGNSALNISSFLTTTNIDDPNDSSPTGGNLVALNIGGGPIEATMTNADTGHLWEGPGTPATNAAGLPTFPDVLMNPGRAIRPNERNLISDTEANLLAQIYGYTITQPSSLNSMLVNPNFTTNALTVSGQSGVVNDLIVIQQHPTISTAYLVTETPVASGTTYSEIVPKSETDSITVNAGDGDDIVRVEYNNGKPTTLNGGEGNDFFDFSFGLKNLSNITGATTVNGGNGTDSIFAYDNSVTTAPGYSVTVTRLDRNGWGGVAYGTVEHLQLTTGTAADSVNVASTAPVAPIVINSAGGTDTVVIGSGTRGLRDINGSIEVQNDPSFTSVLINDTGSAINRSWTIDNLPSGLGSISGVAASLSAVISWDNSDINDITLLNGSGSDSGLIARMSETLYINNAGGNDTIRMGSVGAGGMQAITQGRAGGITIDSDSTVTDFVFDDTGDSAGRNVSMSLVNDYYQLTGLAPATIRFDDFDANNVTLRGGSGADAFNVIYSFFQFGGISIEAGGGTDSAVFNMSVVEGDQTIDFSSTAFTNSSGTPFGYSGIETLDLYTAGYNDHVTVSGLPAITALRYFAGNGTDRMDVGRTDGSTDNSWTTQVLGNVTFFGEGGADTLGVSDKNLVGSAAATYTLINGRISTPTSHQVNFDSLCETFEFNSRTAGASTLNVVNYNPTQHLVLHGQLNSPSADFLNIDDRAMSGPPTNPASVEIYPTQIKRFFSYIPTQPNIIDYDGWEAPTYYGNTANSNVFKIFGLSSSVPAALQYSLFGGTAPDTFTYYPHDASGALTMNANIGVTGDAGYDTITFDDTAGTSGINYVFNNPFGGGQTNVSGMGSRGMGFGNDFEDATIKGGSGNDTIRVDSYLGTTRLTALMGNGNDSIDYTPTSKNIGANIRNHNVIGFDGQGGTGDRSTIWNDNNTSPWFYQDLSGSVLVDLNDGLTGTSHVQYQLTALNTETTVARGGSAADSFSVNATTAQPLTVVGAGGLDSVSVIAGQALFDASDDLSSLNVNGGGSALVKQNGDILLSINVLFLGTNSKLDLMDNDLMIKSSSPSMLNSIRSMIATAAASGSWNGTQGITSTSARNNASSTTALGILSGADYAALHGGTFHGITPGANDVLVKYTYYGDVNFDGTTDGLDYIFIDNGFLNHATGWANGDVNYDGTVDGLDYIFVDNAFLSHGPQL